MLYDLVIAPIESVVEFSFLLILDKISFVGILGALVGVSLVINFLALPLYNVADSIKEKERLVQLRLQKQSDRIKKAFKGDERFMMMQTMYRQNRYHPFYSLRSSLSILIEIPFFIAAYHYLSHNEILRAADISILGWKLNLGSADHTFQIGSLFVNVLPVLMTLINVVSSLVYAKNAPRKEKIQLYALSLIFLALLYESPSGLVFYWICNNVFSLVKNLLQKSKYASRMVYAVMAAVLFLMCVGISLQKSVSKTNAMIAWCALVAFLLVPFLAFRVFACTTRNALSRFDSFSESLNPSLFVLSAVGLFLFLGFVLPSGVISTSPIEFSCLGETDSPFSYVVSTSVFFLGLCVFWPSVIYRMFGKRVRAGLSLLLFALLFSAVSNVYLFGYSYGNISQTFAFENKGVFDLPGLFYVIPPILVFLCASALFLLSKNRKVHGALFSVLSIVCLAEVALGVSKSAFILSKYNAHKDDLLAAKNAGKQKSLSPVFSLARGATGKRNVVVIFLDRGISSFVPRILEQYPNLKSSFDGFTWYRNSLSFGNFTTTGAPAMLAGYEYTPEKINARGTELLRDKHNEATLVMPKLFLDAGWSVTVTDPPLPNYSEKTDLSAFRKFPEIKVSELAGRYDANYLAALNKKGREVDKVCRKQARNFSVILSLFPAARLYFYNIVKDAINETSFEHNYASLYFFNELTDFGSENDNFLFIENDATHPDSDSPDWGEEDSLLISEDEVKKYYDFKDSSDLVHYRVNALCLRAVGKWLDYLKENDAYDNTRIIVVSDHGRGIHLEEFMDYEDYKAPAFFSALLMFKDFGIRGGVKTDDTFMMNADTLFLAKEGLGIADENPFTKEKFTREKDGPVHAYYAATTSLSRIYDNRTFDLETYGGWAVKEDIHKKENWERLK